MISQDEHGDDHAPTHPMRALGERIEEARLRRGWTYEEFAEKTGESSSRLHYLVKKRTKPLDYHELKGIVKELSGAWDDEWERLWQATVRERKVHGDTPTAATSAAGALNVADTRTGDSATPPELDRIRRLSRRLADDLDVVAVPRDTNRAGTGGVKRLSEGLYVRRSCQDWIMRELAAVPEPSLLVVHGEAGYGKSSLMWGLYKDLRLDDTVEPLLISSTWLINGPGAYLTESRLVTIPDILTAAGQAQDSGRSTVVLLDTADLLLHSETDRLTTLDLCEAVVGLGAKIVLACRTREATLIPTDGRPRFGLTLYHESDEFPTAVASHVAAFCTDVSPTDLSDKVRELRHAVSAGLPVREVCLSPLTMRMLFEMSEPQFPATELDVARLNDEYWEYAVVRDRRRVVDPDTSPGPDLAEPAMAAGIALLSAGRTELPETVITSYMSTVLRDWTTGDHRPQARDRVTLRSDLDELRRRHVMLEANDVQRFNHQTLFEQAAPVASSNGTVPRPRPASSRGSQSTQPTCLPVLFSNRR
ncbi:helix-turn-helix domain-containing protein [Micromonospora sp. NPDC049903]|uniref:helix-turn-helix domain-containing protein n=1 Tax=Micromonospora sp. NPDC049903 TaxID=3364276 RepID=UPI003788E465